MGQEVVQQPKIDDGGQAFPCVNPHYDGNWNPEPTRSGMTLRDYFAGQALVGLSQIPLGQRFSTVRGLAVESYIIADEMLKTRSL